MRLQKAERESGVCQILAHLLLLGGKYPAPRGDRHIPRAAAKGRPKPPETLPYEPFRPIALVRIVESLFRGGYAKAALFRASARHPNHDEFPGLFERRSVDALEIGP